MQFDLPAFLSGLGGILIGSGILLFWLRTKLAEITALKRALEDLQAGRLATIERSIERVQSEIRGMQQSDAVPRLEERLKSLDGLLRKLDSTLGRLAETTAGQAEQIRSNREFIENINTCHREHVRDREAHAHG